ncbi:hypothetical protein D3C84_593540 [compost metagenome]
MTKIKLRLAPILRAELDMLFTALVFHPQFVESCCPDNVAGAVLLRHMIDMAGIMQRMGNIRTVRIAFVEGNRHLSTLNEREVKTVFIPAVRFGQAHRHAFLSRVSVIQVRIKFHPVQAGFVLPGVDIPLFGAGHSRRHRAGHFRTRQQRRTPAENVTVRHPR